MSLAVAATRPDVEIRLNDGNAALAALWSEVVERPVHLADRYERLWTQQLSDPRASYDEVRDRFNAAAEPALLLYLLARCVKAAVRFNRRGEFNQSPDNRRLGSRPATMRRHLVEASTLLGRRTRVTAVDFREALAAVRTDDVVYLDPPYQGVVATRDRRYGAAASRDEIVHTLEDLNRRGLSYVLSYDGRTGDRVHGRPLPPFLGLRRFELDAGRSTQSTLSGGDARTVESLYLSPALLDRASPPPGWPRACT